MTKQPRKVCLTRHDRKDRLGHGGIKAVAEELGVDAALVSRVVNGKQRHAGVEDAVSRRVVQAPNETAFPPREPPSARTFASSAASESAA